MTKNHKKKENKARDATDLVLKENVNDYATSKAPKPSPANPKGLPAGHPSLKNNKSTVAPKDQVGLLVTAELEKAIEECKAKVAQIVKGCLASNRKFRDVEFDLENDKIRCLKGLNYDGEESLPPSVLRVTEIFEDPHFFIDGADAIDITQGSLGDCYFLSAMATMSTSKGLIEKLCVALDEKVGVYGFVFFKNATWVSVIIDDQLCWSFPKFEELSGQEQALYRDDRETYNKLSRHGAKGLYFASSGTEGETWVPLIEKAYAKLHGDYESLEGGFPSEAVEDLTGGVSVMYRTKDILDTDRFWREELSNATVDRLFGCFFRELDTSRKTEMIVEVPKINGLIGSHAYSILRVKECRGKRFLVLRNPWGKSEWTGAWGDGSKEWTGEWLDVLKELNHGFGDDGEFVMEYSDFLETFEVCERTYLFDSSWKMSSHWLRAPPQSKYKPWGFGDLSFSFVLNEAAFTIVALSQMDTRYFEGISGTSAWNIDFVVYKRGDTEITAVSYYAIVMSRSVSCELHLEAGEYIVYPRCDRYAMRDEGYFAERSEEWNDRKLARVLTERAKSRSIAANLPEGIESKYIPVSIEALIEEDLQKLQEENQDVVEDDGNGEWKEDSEEGSDAEEEENAGMVEGPPGSDYQDEDEEYYPNDLEDEDTDTIILGVRIYTKGGVAVSVTGSVFGEVIIEEKEEEEEEEDKGKGKGKGKDKGKDKDEGKDEGKDKDEDEDKDEENKEKAKKKKKAAKRDKRSSMII